MSQRYHGLTDDQRDETLIAVREDTMVDDGDGFPARQSDITTPADGDIVDIWYDASHQGAFLNARSDDSPTYNATAGGVDIDSGEDYHVVGDVNFKNLQFFEATRLAQDWCLTVRSDLQTTLADNSSAEILGDSGTRPEAGIHLVYDRDSNGNPGLRVWSADGSNTLWDSGQQDASQAGGFNAGMDTITVTYDSSASTVKMELNSTKIWEDTSASTASSGTDSAHVMGLGTTGGLSADGTLDAAIRGVMLDPTRFDVGAAQETWIDGGDYTP